MLIQSINVPYTDLNNQHKKRPELIPVAHAFSDF